MAAKTHVDSSVGERRLRPIYEWLDNGNNKKALQEAEKVLKKQPNFLCAKVLKALALLRLGKEEDCEQLLEAVRAEVPADDSTLQAMTICYREVHRPEKICEIYEAAVRKEPSSEELLTHLFMAYVRVADYKKQQQTALQLYRLKPKNPYYFWAVMSVVMQAHKAEPCLAQGVVLPLAERMVQKLVREDRIEAEQEVQLYLMVLEMQSKFEDALRVVEGPLGEKLISYVVVPVKTASLLMKLERWREANILYKQLLREDMDRWSHLTNYLTTCLKLFDSGQQNGNNNTLKTGSPTTTNNINNNQDSTNKVVSKSDSTDIAWDEADTTLTACIKFLDHIVKAADKEVRRLRGPYLVHLELHRMLSEQGIDALPRLGSPVDLLIRYVEHFAHKPCCVSDLRPFLPLLSPADEGPFLQRLAAVTKREPSSGAAALQRHVCGLQLARMLGAHLELTELQRQNLASELQRFYRESADICPENLQTEFACNDPYALLAAHVLMDSWLATGRSAPLVRAAQTLELALARSPANFHIKLLLLRMYTALGAGAAADAVYELLDVKHMQLDSLGYLHCAQLAQLGQLRAAAALYEITLKFFTANYKDGVDHLTYSYKFGSFLKILEFVEFCERLNNSLHYALTTVERMLLEVMECPTANAARASLAGMEVQPWKDSVAWDALQDNRDTSILTGWEPPSRQVTQEHLRQSFGDDVALLRVRSLLLRVLAAAAELPTTTPSTSAPAPRAQEGTLVNGGGTGAVPSTSSCALLEQLALELSTAAEAAAARPPPPAAPAPACAPPPSRLHTLVAAGSMPPLADAAAALAACAAASRGGVGYREDTERRAEVAADGAAAAAARAAARARAQARAAAGPEPSLPDALADRRQSLALAVAATEMLALAALLVGAGRAALRPPPGPGANVRRARRRKPQEGGAAAVGANTAGTCPTTAVDGDWTVGCLSGLAGALHAAALTLDAALADWEGAAEAAEAEADTTPGGDEEVVARLASLAVEVGGGRGERVPPTPGPPPSAAALVRARLADSLRASLRELRRVLQSKVQYLGTLRQV